MPRGDAAGPYLLRPLGQVDRLVCGPRGSLLLPAALHSPSRLPPKAAVMTAPRTPAQVGKANRRAGRELERATELLLQGAGYFVIKTGSGQGQPVDLVALGPMPHPDPWLIQCKAGGYVPPAERQELRLLGDRYASDPVVAYWHKDGRKARTVKFRDLEGNEVQP